MQTKWIKIGAVGLGFLAVATYASLAQQSGNETLGERLQDVGRGLKNGVRDVGDGVRRRFDGVRADVNRMETQSRVYARLHWDKVLYTSKIEVHMLRDGTALLVGKVPDQAAREHAVELTRDTVGITSVIDDLTPLTTPAVSKSTPVRSVH